MQLRRWQREALALWEEHGNRGIVSVVTGGGKTVFALACIAQIKAMTSLIVVPTTALLDQWWEEAAAYFGWSLDEIHIVSGNMTVKAGTINIAVINTASKLFDRKGVPDCFLIVDECHRAAAPMFSSVLKLETFASLGLSATPRREYDEGLEDVLIPALGPIIYEYDYADARRDGVIVPFILRNIIFDLEEERQREYERLTRAIAQSLRKEGPESDKTISLLLRRARLISLSKKRVEIALKLVAGNRGKRILIFHEDIHASEVIAGVLKAHSIRAAVYHSRMNLRRRAQVWSGYRNGALEVLVTCRALDEGFNVPETEIGIVAASIVTRRQRMQRLGRILRPSVDKESALIYTLVATVPEILRLQEEEAVRRRCGRDLGFRMRIFIGGACQPDTVTR